jgi:hypothetical protein
MNIEYFSRGDDQLPFGIVGDSRDGLHAVSPRIGRDEAPSSSSSHHSRWNTDGKSLYKSRWKVRSDLEVIIETIQTAVTRYKTHTWAFPSDWQWWFDKWDTYYVSLSRNNSWCIACRLRRKAISNRMLNGRSTYIDASIHWSPLLNVSVRDTMNIWIVNAQVEIQQRLYPSRTKVSVKIGISKWKRRGHWQSKSERRFHAHW